MTPARPATGGGASARRRFAYAAASVAIAAVLLGVVLTQLDLDDLARTLAATRWSWVAVAAATMLVFQVFRTARTRLLAGEEGPWLPLYAALCLQSVLAKLLPGMLGEAALVWLLRSLHAVRLHRGVATLLVARLADMALFTVVLVAVLLLSAAGRHTEIAWVAAILAGLVVLALAGWAVTHRLHARWTARRPANEIGTGRWRRLLGRALDQVGELLEALRQVSARGNLVPLLLYSAAMWLAMWFAFVCYLRALGSDLDGLEILYLYVVIFPMSLLPVRGVGNLGTHEAAWFLALSALDLPAGEAALFAVGSHVLMFVVTGVLALVAIFGFLAAGRREARRQGRAAARPPSG